MTRRTEGGALRGALALALGLASAACNTSGDHKLNLHPEDCEANELRTDAECGTFRVWEDREQGAGRRIPLAVARIPALASAPQADPLFILVGGPGQSALKSGLGIASTLRDVHKTRDIVLVDQRGTGLSNPLKCPEEREGLQRLFESEFQTDELTQCLAALDAAPEHYTTPIAMADLDDVRQALGYARINLWGGSYGTRAAMVYARQYPASTRRLVLDGPAPLAIKLPLYSGRDAQRALDMLSQDCSSEAVCADRFGSTTDTVNQILARLGASPQPTRFTHPRTGLQTDLTLTRDGFAAALRLQLYVPTLASVLPLSLHEAYEGRFGPFITGALALGDRIDSDMAQGMFLSVVCAEDLPQMTPAEVTEHSKGHFLGPSFLDPLKKACSVWPKGKLPADYFRPLTFDAPTLVLSGEYDPIIPPSWGEQITKQLPHATHIIVPGAGHGVTGLACIPQTIAEFLDSATPEATSAPCVERMARPAIFTTFIGAKP